MTAPSRVTVLRHTPDPMCRAGVVSLLGPRPGITLVDTVGPAVDTQGPAVRDSVRLSDARPGRPGLLQAVMDGYGAAHGGPELVERGRPGPPPRCTTPLTNTAPTHEEQHVDVHRP
ncbi:hypothetical protein AB0469_15310 [Streptomyces sp. NPDC093801]|uniref:hypothetical protein n=1 Tax=Streptomyces sp. NPDC093801 TaxID=3155203 RepID=UPI00344E0CD8